MRLLKPILTHKAFSRFAPALSSLDARVLCIQHRRATKRGMSVLSGASCYGARQMLDALKSARVDKAIERERSRLLVRHDRLGNAGAYDADWTISSAAAISKSPRQAGLLASMVGAFSPEYAIELGTNVGISSAYIASAIQGKFVTLEASPARLTLAREVHGYLGVDNVEYVEGMFADTLQGALESVPFVDFAFIDGHHHYQPTVDYFKAIVQHARLGAVFIFDDIRFSAAMKKAWDEISADDRFGLIVDFWTMGACIIRKDEEPRVVTEPIACY